MQNAVLRHFPDARVVIRFTNRNPSQLFSRECFQWIEEHVNSTWALGSASSFDTAGLSTLSLTASERTALQKACPYFPESYLDWLADVRLNPKEEVQLEFLPRNDGGSQGEISCIITGFWRTCILYEVPIMSISE